jgi:hypothetical protein
MYPENEYEEEEPMKIEVNQILTQPSAPAYDVLRRSGQSTVTSDEEQFSLRGIELDENLLKNSRQNSMERRYPAPDSPRQGFGRDRISGISEISSESGSEIDEDEFFESAFIASPPSNLDYSPPNSRDLRSKVEFNVHVHMQQQPNGLISQVKRTSLGRTKSIQSESARQLSYAKPVTEPRYEEKVGYQSMVSEYTTKKSSLDSRIQEHFATSDHITSTVPFSPQPKMKEATHMKSPNSRDITPVVTGPSSKKTTSTRIQSLKAIEDQLQRIEQANQAAKPIAGVRLPILDLRQTRPEENVFGFLRSEEKVELPYTTVGSKSGFGFGSNREREISPKPVKPITTRTPISRSNSNTENKPALANTTVSYPGPNKSPVSTRSAATTPSPSRRIDKTPQSPSSTSQPIKIINRNVKVPTRKPPTRRPFY